jgi:uncharacterized protein YegJ (DUF2314 family)
MAWRRILLATPCVLLACAAACESRNSKPCGHVCSYFGPEAAADSAHARARATVDVLLAALARPSPSLTYASAQVRVANDSLGEHIWLDSVHVSGGELVGTLSEDATGLVEFRRGMEIRVAPAEVSDWMTIENGRMCGGFVLRVDWRRLVAEERARFLRAYRVSRLPPGDRVCDDGAGAER